MRSWLYGIATNLLRSHWRAEQHLLELDARLAAINWPRFSAHVPKPGTLTIRLKG